MQVGIIGATGYTGYELVRLLMQHPKIENIHLFSNTNSNKKTSEFFNGIKLNKKVSEFFLSFDEIKKNNLSAYFTALPHKESASFYNVYLKDKSTVLIDLSADFRINDAEKYNKVYGATHPCKEFLNKAVYGLTEWNRQNIKSADIIANPGCYPTCNLLAIFPFLKENLIESDIIINSLSGISGAGKKLSENILFTHRTENMNAYNPGQTHRHLAEMEQEVNKINKKNLWFTPHLIPVKRGMFSTIVFDVKKINTKNAFEILEKYYKDESFIILSEDRIPETREVIGTNYCKISVDVQNNKMYIFSVIDNLLKGASGQAIQNMNCKFNFEESLGLEYNSIL